MEIIARTNTRKRSTTIAFMLATATLLSVAATTATSSSVDHRDLSLVKTLRPVQTAAALSRSPQVAAPRPGSLGVLTLNVNGLNHPQDASWDTRAMRIADWARSHQALPDVIALQEVFGWLHTGLLRSCGLGFGLDAGDYDQIDTLLHELKAATGIIYRIAYLTGREQTWGGSGPFGCTAYGAQAMLYNPDRLVNLTAQGDSSRAFSYDAQQYLSGVPHLRRSLPLCHRGIWFMPLDALIDGPLQSEGCSF